MTRFKVFLAAIAVGLVGCNPSSAQVTKQTTAKAAQPAAKATAQAVTLPLPADFPKGDKSSSRRQSGACRNESRCKKGRHGSNRQEPAQLSQVAR